MTAAAAAAAAASAAAADSANGLAWIRPKSNLQVMLCPSVTVSRILAVATPVAHLLSHCELKLPQILKEQGLLPMPPAAQQPAFDSDVTRAGAAERAQRQIQIHEFSHNSNVNCSAHL